MTPVESLPQPEQTLHVDGLLHLGALVVVLTLGYLGVDRLHSERSNLNKALSDARKRVRSVLEHAFPDNGEDPRFLEVEVPTRDFLNKPFALLCKIGQVKVKNMSSLDRFSASYHCFSTIPLLSYFRCKADRYIVSVFALFASISYFLLVYSTIGHVPGVVDISGQTLLKGLFFSYLVITMWVVITASVAALKLLDMENLIKINFSEFNRLAKQRDTNKINKQLENISNAQESGVNGSRNGALLSTKRHVTETEDVQVADTQEPPAGEIGAADAVTSKTEAPGSKERDQAELGSM